MSLGQALIGAFGTVGVLLSGLSWLHWCREIASDVNATLPMHQRVTWGITEAIPAGALHRFWAQHEQLFPASKKRAYAAASLVLVFLIGILSFVAYVLQ